MAKLERNTTINAPVEKVFSYLTDPNNRVEWLPGSTDIRNISGQGLGQRWDYTYRAAGRNLKGGIEVTEYTPNQRYAHKSTGGVVSTWIYSFHPQPDGTGLSLEVDLHATPIPVIGKIVEGLVRRRGERQANLVLSNIKRKLEA